MFERAAIIHPGLQDQKIDVGRILDSMLYYSHVELIADSRVITGLWDFIGKDGTKTLLNHPSLQVQITPELPAIINKTNNGITCHSPINITASGREGKHIDPSDTIGAIHQLINNKSPTPISYVRSTLRGITSTRFAKIFSEQLNRGDMFESLISDSSTMRLFLSACARKNGIQIRSTCLEKLNVEVLKTSDGFMIANNIDLEDILISDKEVRWQDILPLILYYRYDLHLSQSRSSDIISNDTNSYIASQRIDLSINRAIRSNDRKTAFEQFAFDDARPFGNAFMDGKIDLQQCLNVIDKTHKFRSWLNGLPPEADVIREYHKAVNRDTILGKLPSRTARFSMFTGAGVALDIMATGGLGTLAGVGLSAFDSFVLDGLVKGWRPNTFVDTVKKATESHD